MIILTFGFLGSVRISADPICMCFLRSSSGSTRRSLQIILELSPGSSSLAVSEYRLTFSARAAVRCCCSAESAADASSGCCPLIDACYCSACSAESAADASSGCCLVFS